MDEVGHRLFEKMLAVASGEKTKSELAGVGGINGRAALEGTMLGPGLLMGRIAARDAVAKLKSGGNFSAAKIASAPTVQPPTANTTDPESLREWREVLR